MALAGAVCPVSASAALNGSTTVRDIAPYVYPANAAKGPSQFSYLPDGTQYAMLAQDSRSIVTYDIRTGKETGVLVDLNRTREVQVPDIEGFQVSPDGKYVLMWRNSQAIYRRSSTAEYYVYEIRTRLMDKLSPNHERTGCVVWSPDSRMLAFVADNNIYLKKLTYNNEVAVTKDGKAGSIINGATDWTYEEEFATTHIMAWSPDNTMLCFVSFDESQVPTYTLPLYEGTCNPMTQYAQYPGQLSYKYPVAGQVNSKVTLNAYDVDNRKTTAIPLPDKNIEYIPRIDFGPTPQQLMVSTLNRDQNRYELYSVNPRSTTAKSVLVENSKAWVATDTYESITFDSDGFTVMSDRSGYMHLYKYGYNGQLLRTLTSGNYDVTAYYGHDKAGNHYYQAAKPTPMDRTVCRLDAKNRVTVLGRETGANSATLSPDGSFAVMRYSDPVTPPVYTLAAAATGRELRVLQDNSRLKASATPRLVNKEFITIPSDGNQLNAYILRPADFDASRKYPVIMWQYSGPGSQEVLNRWEYDWMYYAVSKGFIVVCVDPRGTGGRGTAFMHCVYKDLGHYETIDQTNAARYVATLPGVDAKRIGIAGWSYGGYETLMCATDPQTPFAAACAIAPVTDWRYYDTVYAERYMLTPQQNASGYNASAPLKRVSRLGCPTLIMYGTADDNVHPANSLQFVSALQSAGGFCDMFVFPNMNHSINGCNARAVVYGKMVDYFSHTL